MTSLKASTVRDGGMRISSQLPSPLIDFGEMEGKRIRRKPNFTIQERMHLAKSYVESHEEYNRASSHSRDSMLGKELPKVLSRLLYSSWSNNNAQV